MLNRSLLRTKVLRSTYAHLSGERKGGEITLKEYRKSVEMCYDLHLFLLDILSETAYFGKERQRIASEKIRPTQEDLNPKTRFVDNPIIEAIRRNESIQARLAQGGLSWGDYDDVIREIYFQITSCGFYKTYVDGAGKDREFILRILTQVIDNNELIEKVIDDKSILWVDDYGYAMYQAVSFIESGYDSEILPMYKNAEDKNFGEDLLLHAVSHSAEYLELIESLSANWEIERIAFMDKVILIVAISELVSCPTIPTKVTLNEYIEISKYYSSATSANFINGVLHEVIEKLTENGKIRKTGRGLVGERISK